MRPSMRELRCRTIGVFAFMTLALGATLAPEPATAMRPIDLEYAQHPEKRSADFARMKEQLDALKPTFEAAEAKLGANQKTDAAKGFISVAGLSMNALYLYEALGLAAKNPNFPSQNYLLLQLESELENRQTVTEADGRTVNKPLDPEAAKILTYAGSDDVDLSVVDVERLHAAASKIMRFMNAKVLSMPELLVPPKEPAAR